MMRSLSKKGVPFSFSKKGKRLSTGRGKKPRSEKKKRKGSVGNLLSNVNAWERKLLSDVSESTKSNELTE